MSDKNSMRTMEIQHHGLTLVVSINNFMPATPMPFANTPDCPGWDDEGSAAEIDFEVVSVEVDCSETMIEAFGLNDCEELAAQLIEDMER